LSRYIGVEPANDGSSLGSEVHRILAGQAPASPEAAELAERFRKSDLGQRAARATRIEHEFDFLFYVADVVLRGQIDLWFEEAGELVLVDYKTDRDEAPRMYELQLRLYALALERYAGRTPERAVLYYLRSDRPVDVSLTAAELEQAKEVVREFTAAQERLDFPLKLGPDCRRCRFLGNACPARL
jgi:ATP-dependent exoDNAse (exonuclease V) beta subunit